MTALMCRILKYFPCFSIGQLCMICEGRPLFVYNRLKFLRVEVFYKTEIRKAVNFQLGLCGLNSTSHTFNT